MSTGTGKKIRPSVDRNRSMGAAGAMNRFGGDAPAPQPTAAAVDTAPVQAPVPTPAPEPVVEPPAARKAATSRQKVERVNHNYRFVEPVSTKLLNYYADWSTKSRRLRRLRRQPSEAQFVQALLVFAIDYLERHPEESDTLESLLPQEGRSRRRGA